MDRFLLVLYCMTFFMSCNSKDQESKIAIRYLDETTKNTMIVEIVKNPSDTLYQFSEKYTIPVSHLQNGLVDTIKYIDRFYFIENIGLFRKLNSLTINSIDNTIGHFYGFLWMPNSIFKGKRQSYITYGDRSFLKRKFVDVPDNLPQYKIIYHGKIFCKVFKDTLQTFIIKNLNYGGSSEIRTYDSNFNLIKYVYQRVNGIESEFIIIDDDYKRLKDFRFSEWPFFK